MSDIAPDETRLAAEIERLKADFPKTRELYREACALLFFRFGITPTANRLYQLVRKGSMSTPTAVLGEFWAELREKSRVRIERIRSAWLPRGKSVRPIEPANSTSPTIASLLAREKNTTWPGVWPGQ